MQHQRQPADGARLSAVTKSTFELAGIVASFQKAALVPYGFLPRFFLLLFQVVICPSGAFSLDEIYCECLMPRAVAFCKSGSLFSFCPVGRRASACVPAVGGRADEPLLLKKNRVVGASPRG